MQPQKTPEQIEAMRAGGHILAQIFTDIRGYVHAGMTEKEVDAFVAQRITEYGAEATYKTPEVKTALMHPFAGNFSKISCIFFIERVTASDTYT